MPYRNSLDSFATLIPRYEPDRDPRVSRPRARREDSALTSSSPELPGVHATKARRSRRAFVQRNPGDVLLSQGASPQVPSALTGLTAVFGMGTGVSPPLWPPEILLWAIGTGRIRDQDRCPPSLP